jgi:hypothetical protein
MNMKELEALKKLKEENQIGGIWWNKRIRKLELAKDFETLEAVKQLESNSNIVAELKKAAIKTKYKDLKIVVQKSSGNNMPKGEHKILSRRLDRADWETVKHCFKFTDTRKINDEAWGDIFVGYEIINEDELRKILNF